MAAYREQPLCNKAIEDKFKERKVGEIMATFVVSVIGVTI